MRVTLHASDRLKQRCNLSKSAIESTSERAYLFGHRRESYSGSFRRYLDKEFHVGHNDIRVYSMNIWVFAGDKLITVWAVPPRYRKYKPAEAL